jgi:uncharacterized surface protein with fasciclin (FAS1) repeats
MVNTRTLYVETKNIVEKGESLHVIKNFMKAVRGSGMARILSSKGPFTVFAPDDAAFVRLPGVTLKDLMKDIERVTDMVKFHIIQGMKVLSTDFQGIREFMTMDGHNLFLNSIGAARVNDALIVQPDIECSNGVIHIIDTILSPR